MRIRTAPTASSRRAVPGWTFTAVAITTLALLSACSSDDGNSGDANSPRNERSPQPAPKFTGEAALDLSATSTPRGARMTVAVTAPLTVGASLVPVIVHDTEAAVGVGAMPSETP